MLFVRMFTFGDPMTVRIAYSVNAGGMNKDRGSISDVDASGRCNSYGGSFVVPNSICFTVYKARVAYPELQCS